MKLNQVIQITYKQETSKRSRTPHIDLHKPNSNRNISKLADNTIFNLTSVRKLHMNKFRPNRIHPHPETKARETLLQNMKKGSIQLKLPSSRDQ